MPPKNPLTDPAAHLQWLADRAAISDLLIDFARALDDKDWDNPTPPQAGWDTPCLAPRC